MSYAADSNGERVYFERELSVTDSREQLYHLAKQCLEDSERWFGDSGKVHDLPHHGLGLGGETGEVLEIIKKIDRGSLDLSDPNVEEALALELTDVLIYVLNLAAILNIDLQQTYNQKRSINEDRFMRQRRERESR